MSVVEPQGDFQSRGDFLFFSNGWLHWCTLRFMLVQIGRTLEPYSIFPPQDRLRPATRTAAATIGLHNQSISEQTVRNRLREAHLHARRPQRGLDLTAVRHRNRLEWADAHIRWHLALWRGVLLHR